MKKRFTVVLLSILFLACAEDRLNIDGITETDSDGNVISVDCNDWNGRDTITDGGGYEPAQFSVGPAFPNPTTDSVTIFFRLAMTGNFDIKIVNTKKNTILNLLSGFMEPGKYIIAWDLTGKDGKKLKSGTYRCIYTFKQASNVVFSGYGDIEIL